MRSFFITSSGTGIGKTFVTCQMIRQLRAKGLSVIAQKPVISGWEEPANDTFQILEALKEQAPERAIEKISLYRLKAPLSPDMAAEQEGVTIDKEALLRFCRPSTPCDIHLIEGAGGIMVPLNGHFLTADWIKALDIPIILVVGSYLGSISHTLTALRTAESYGIPVSHIVISASEDAAVPLEVMAKTVQNFTDVPLLLLPRGDASTVDLITPIS